MREYSKDFLVELYKRMLEIRLCEENFVEPILNGEIKCPVHLCSGQEAVAVGVCAALQKEDYLFGNHRSHGHYLAKGGSLSGMISEVFCKGEGCSKGKGGSMHLVDPAVGMMGSAPIVAGTVSLAVGAALASQIRSDDRVSVSFFGDGATNEGVLYESLNFASLKKLPVIFVCENNLYATHMPIGECRPNSEIFRIAAPFDIPAERVDGNDVLAVYKIAQKDVTACRKGDGPFFIECLTYRLRGHVGPDDNIQGTHTDIRPDEELAFWKTKDPISNFENFLLETQIIKADERDALQEKIGRIVADAYETANNCKYPTNRDLFDDVFSK